MSVEITMPAAVLERFCGVLERLEARLGNTPAPVKPASGNELLKTAEVAERLGKSVRDVQRMVRRGRLKKVSGLGGRTTRFRALDVERLLCGDQLPGRRTL